MLTFGRILTIFRHTFLSATSSVLVFVSWFENAVKDRDTNLTYVLMSSQTQSIVPIIALSKPLIVAFDEEEYEKLWILNL